MNTRVTGRTVQVRAAAWLIVALIGFGAACLSDAAVFRAIDFPRAEREDWCRLLRVMGYLPLWLLAAVALVLSKGTGAKQGRRIVYGEALLVALAPTLAGLLAEALKLLIRRERPNDAGLAYSFRAFAEKTFSTSGLGLPSSHVAVAFAAAGALCVIAPRAWPVWMLLATGCAFTRLAERAHWFSDVFGAAALGLFVAWGLSLLLGARTERE